MSPRYIIISGAIGAGKSTVCQLLSNTKRYAYIPEYIDEAGGLEMLGKFKEKKISDYVFQKYILTYYEKKLDKHDSIVVIERSPVEGVAIFFPAQKYPKEAAELIEKAKNLEKFAGVFEKCVVWINVDNRTPEMITDIIQDFLEKYDGNIMFYLRASAKTCLRRIRIRGRREEKEIDLEFMNKMVDEYDKYCSFNIIEKI